MRFCFFVFFFKQKTAYEMRISDWSSDVCSSDLREAERAGAGDDEHRNGGDEAIGHGGRGAEKRPGEESGNGDDDDAGHEPARNGIGAALDRRPAALGFRTPLPVAGEHGVSSEERGVGQEWVITCRSWWRP